MILTCKCGKVWDYKGMKKIRKDFPVYTSCPDCKRSVKVEKKEKR